MGQKQVFVYSTMDTSFTSHQEKSLQFQRNINTFFRRKIVIQAKVIVLNKETQRGTLSREGIEFIIIHDIA